MVMNMKMALLGVDNTERCDEVGDNHEGEEDEDEEVQVGGQQGKDEAPEMTIIDIIGENSFHSDLSVRLFLAVKQNVISPGKRSGLHIVELASAQANPAWL